MTTEELAKKLKECFKNAEKDEKEGKKHKGLLATEPSDEKAKFYIQKAKESLELCKFYKEKRFDYKIPEEWFYALYYCGLAILSKVGVETRSQKWTALFLEYVTTKKIIDYDPEFIKRIMVHSEKGKESEVDERENARYGPLIKIEKVFQRYDEMTELCKKAISQAEEIIYSDKKFEIPKELME